MVPPSSLANTLQGCNASTLSIELEKGKTSPCMTMTFNEPLTDPVG